MEKNPLISVLMPVYNPISTYLNEAVESVVKQNYENWELCICDDGSNKKNTRKTLEKWARKDDRVKVVYSRENQGISHATNKARKTAKGVYLGFLDQDDKLLPNCLSELVNLLNAKPGTRLVYTNEALIQARAQKVIFTTEKPAYSPDLLLSKNYINHFSLVESKIFDELEGLNPKMDGAQDHDLMLRISEKTSKIEVLDKTLYLWRKRKGSFSREDNSKKISIKAGEKAVYSSIKRRGFESTVRFDEKTSSYTTQIKVKDNPLVSIIIPFRDKTSILKNCVDSIFEKTEYDNYEIVLMDNQSKEEEMIDYLDDLSSNEKVKIVKYDKKFNYAAINNEGVKKAGGDYILFLNNDVKVLKRGWIKELVGRCQLNHVGVVGAYLIYPDGKVQHAGVAMKKDLDLGLMFSNIFELNRLGKKGISRYPLNCLAVTGACMMVKRRLFERVGGFDEELTVFFNDTDLCLMIRDLGYFITYDPNTTLIHYEGISRTEKDDALRKKNHDYLDAKWMGRIEHDPYLNPQSSLFFGDLHNVSKKTKD